MTESWDLLKPICMSNFPCGPGLKLESSVCRKKRLKGVECGVNYPSCKKTCYKYYLNCSRMGITKTTTLTKTTKYLGWNSRESQDFQEARKGMSDQWTWWFVMNLRLLATIVQDHPIFCDFQHHQQKILELNR